jgi:hypothetical protein
MERFQCYIREQFRHIPKRNKISGHCWFEHGPTTAWLVMGPFTPISRHRTEKGAEKALIEWQGYYNRLAELDANNAA